jgi:hypothetical protein
MILFVLLFPYYEFHVCCQYHAADVHLFVGVTAPIRGLGYECSVGR